MEIKSRQDILYQRGNFKDDIIELICEVKFESSVIESREEGKGGRGEEGKRGRGDLFLQR
jgi:hypothetical protein